MKDIPGYEGRYAITEDGKIWSYPKSSRNPDGMWLKVQKMKVTRRRIKPRYIWMVSLFDEKGKSKRYQVHRLVALTYISNPNNKPMINHKDGNSLNNCVNNLEWMTNKENSDHAFKSGLVKKPLTSGEVVELRKLCQFFPCRKISLAYGFCPSTVWDIFKRRRYAEVI